MQELTARAAWEIGCRLVSVGVLPGQDAVRLLTLGELRAADAAAGCPRRPGGPDRSRRVRSCAAPRFRLTGDGRPLAVVSRSGQGGVGAGSGVDSGPAHLGSERGVPTVVGHAGATTTYREAQRLEVDGTAGTVRVVDAVAAVDTVEGSHQSPVVLDPSDANADEPPDGVADVIPIAMLVRIGARR